MSAVLACAPSMASATDASGKGSGVVSEHAGRPAASTGVRSLSAVLAGDDELPGIDVDFTADGKFITTGTLDAATDLDDVYAVWLMAGEKYSFSATGPMDTDFGLYLYGPGASSFADNPEYGVDPYYYGGPDSYPVAFEYMVPETGYYYIDVWTWNDSGASGGTGEYSLDVNCLRQDTDVVITTTSATTAYNAARTINGHVDGRFFGATGNVYLYYSFDGQDFIPLSAQNYSGGTFSFPSFYQWRKTWYMVVYEGTDISSTNAQTVAFGCYASIYNPSAPSTMYVNRSKTVYSYLKPRHTAGTYPVRIYKYKKVNGSWRSYGYVKAKAQNYSDFTKCVASVKLPSKGSWRLRAYAVADASHAATWSKGYDYVTVK